MSDPLWCSQDVCPLVNLKSGVRHLVSSGRACGLGGDKAGGVVGMDRS